MNTITKLSIALLSSTLLATAGETHHYLSFSTGSLDFDKTVYGDINGFENGTLQAYDSNSLAGIDYTFLKEVEESGFMIGVRPMLLLDGGDFFDGGIFNVNMLMGPSFGKFKLYANAGFGVNSLSEYTVSTGLNYGLTARYDVTKHFSAAVSYNVFDMEITNGEYRNPTDEYQIKGLLGSLSLKF